MLLIFYLLKHYCICRLERGRKPISLRPEIVLTNEEFGHFEVDLIVGAEHKGAILTIVERKTKFLIMRKLSSKKCKKFG